MATQKANTTFLKNFIPPMQMKCIKSLCRGEDGSFYRDIIATLPGKIRAIPPLYANSENGVGLNAPISLHYFGGPANFHISELELETGYAFGIADLGYGPELGNLYIPELLSIPYMELDLYWDETTTLNKIMGYETAEAE